MAIWQLCSSKCLVWWAGGKPVRTRTHHFAHEDGRVGDAIGNLLRCRCLLGIVGGRLAHDRPA